MPKRQADKQLTDRNADDIEDDEPSSGSGYAMASAETIANRPIKGLPGRRSPAKPSTASAFGAPAGGAPAMNGFAGLAAPAPAPADPAVDALIKLRGLNLSALKAFTELTQRITSDPFVDLSRVLDEMAKRYGRAASPPATVAAQVSAANASNGASASPVALSSNTGSPFAAKASEPKAPAAPAPPTAFSFGGSTIDTSKAAPASTSTPVAGGFTPSFTPSAPAEKSAFSFPPAAAPAPAKPAEPAAGGATAFNSTLVAAAAVRKPSPLREAETISSPASAKSSPAKVEPPKSPSKPFANLVGQTFSFSPSLKSTSPAAPAVSAFGGPPATTVAALPPAPAAAPSAFTPAKPDPPAGLFGTGKPPSPKGFGSAKPTTGAPATSTGTVGFSFGALAPTSAATAPSATGAPSASAFGGFGAGSSFSFGVSTPAKPASEAPAPVSLYPPLPSGSTTTSKAASPEPVEGESATAEPPVVPNSDRTAGAGEEDEDTIYEQRGRLYGPPTSELGAEAMAISVMRLKRNRLTGVVRMLARNEATSAVVLNARLFKGQKGTMMDPKGDARPARSVNFPTVNADGSVDLWRWRVRTEALAQVFIDALAKEVAKL